MMQAESAQGLTLLAHRDKAPTLVAKEERSRSHAPRGNARVGRSASRLIEDAIAPQPLSSWERDAERPTRALPRGAWERDDLDAAVACGEKPPKITRVGILSFAVRSLRASPSILNDIVCHDIPADIHNPSATDTLPNLPRAGYVGDRGAP